MNWLDVVLVIFLVLVAFAGFSRGLVRTLVPLIGVIVGVVVAGRYYDAIADIFSSDSKAAYVAVFAIIVVAFLIAAVILAEIVHKVLSLVLLGWVDHLAGLLSGAVIGVIMAGAVLSLLVKHSVGLSTIEDSDVASFVVDKFPAALSLMPGDFDRVKDFFNHKDF